MEPQKPQTVLEYITEHRDAEPVKVLDIVLASTELAREETARAQADVARREVDLKAARDQARESATVKWNPDTQWTIEDLAGLNRLAVMYAQSDMIPDHYYPRMRTEKGLLLKDKDYSRPNIPAVGRTIARALTWKLNIDFVLDKSYVFEGCRKVGLEAQLIHAILRTSGILLEPVQYDYSGDANDLLEGKEANREDPLTCRASCTIKGPNGKPQVIECVVDMNVARRSGWKSKLWHQNPRLILGHRAVAWMVNLNCPEILGGCMEVDDARELERETRAKQAEALRGKSVAELAGIDPPDGKQEPDKSTEEPPSDSSPAAEADSSPDPPPPKPEPPFGSDVDEITDLPQDPQPAEQSPQQEATQEDLDQQAAIVASETADAIRLAECNRKELERLKVAVTGHPGLKADAEEMALAEIAGALERCEPETEAPQLPRDHGKLFDSDHSPNYHRVLKMIGQAGEATSQTLLSQEVETAKLKKGERGELREALTAKFPQTSER